MGSPYHTYGPITPSNTEAEGVMYKRRKELHEVLSGLRRNPPDFSVVRGPLHSGKTTFAWQLVSSLRREPGVMPIFLDLQFLRGAASESEAIAALAEGFEDALLGASSHDTNRVINKLIEKVRADNLGSFIGLRRLLRDICVALPQFDTVLLIVDELDSLEADLGDSFLRFFRAIYASRHTSPLGKLSVMVLTANQLETREIDGTSPYNIAEEVSLNDLPLKAAIAFIDEASGVTGKTWTNEAKEYLCWAVKGQVVILQTLGKLAEDISETDKVTIQDVMGAVARCFEDVPGSISSLLNTDRLSKGGKSQLRRLLHNEFVLPHRVTEGIAELLNRGIARISGAQRCEFRSPLMNYLFLQRYANLAELPVLNDTENALVQLPQVQKLLLDKPLEHDAISNALKSMRERQEPINDMGLFESRIIEYLLNFRPEYDHQSLEFFYNRYFPEASAIPPPPFSKVMEVVGKVFANWALIEFENLE